MPWMYAAERQKENMMLKMGFFGTRQVLTHLSRLSTIIRLNREKQSPRAVLVCRSHSRLKKMDKDPFNGSSKIPSFVHSSYHYDIDDTGT